MNHSALGQVDAAELPIDDILQFGNSELGKVHVGSVFASGARHRAASVDDRQIERQGELSIDKALTRAGIHEGRQFLNPRYGDRPTLRGGIAWVEPYVNGEGRSVAQQMLGTGAIRVIFEPAIDA
jgi:hypothetical protein